MPTTWSCAHHGLLDAVGCRRQPPSCLGGIRMSDVKMEYETTISRTEAAAWLSQLARAFTSGNDAEIPFGPGTVRLHVPGSVRAEVEVEVEDEKVEVEIEFSWPLPARWLFPGARRLRRLLAATASWPMAQARERTPDAPSADRHVRDWLVALDVDDLPEFVVDRHEIPRVLHHRVDGLVGSGDLVQERTGPAPFDALHGGLKLGHAEGFARGCPAVLAPGPMRRAAECQLVPLAGHDVRASAHRAGDQAPNALVGVNRTLAGQPHLTAEVLLSLGVVVMTINHFVRDNGRAHEVGQAVQHAAHHLLAVEQRELLRPAQVADVLLELRGVLTQVGKVRIGQLNVPLLGDRLGGPDVLIGQLVPDAARPRVQERPDPVGLVHADLDEVVA